MAAKILEDILSHKRLEIEDAKRRIPEDKLKKSIDGRTVETRGFRNVILNAKEIRIVAEIKKASPAVGIIRTDFDARKIAECYEKADVAAISVLTETKYFLGRASYLSTIRQVTTCPILRKDFILDAYQIVESAVLRCDAVLLIVSILSAQQLRDFIDRLRDLGIDALAEVHTEEERDQALHAGANLLGINNRDLNTMRVDMRTTERLMKGMPAGVAVVAESGIGSHSQVVELSRSGVHAFLIGTSIMASPDMTEKIRELRGEEPCPS